MTHDGTVAGALARRLAAWGVERLFGIPGGGSLHLIDAADRIGIPFVLTRTETAAALMAATTAELTGRPGAVVTGLGPGIASAVNGIAHAALDRVPVLLIADALDETQSGFVSHQAIDQTGILDPLTKATVRLEGAAVGPPVDAAIEAALAPPRGPVLIELPGSAAGRPAGREEERGRRPVRPATRAFDTDAASALLHAARRPAILLGLGARGEAAAGRRLARALAAPVLTTYKAKGAVAEDDPLHAGLFTGTTAEAPWLSRADLIVRIGLDPVELQPRPWGWTAPVLEIAETPATLPCSAPQAAMIGPIGEAVGLLIDNAGRSGWSHDEIAALRREARLALASPQGGPITPQTLVEAVRRAAPADTRIAVDAGAHMVSAMTFFPARAPGDVLISNGLSTMGLALPAAIAAALAEPERRAIAFTGDGGLMMCAGELATAAELGVPIVVVVFNDAALSLIALKQQALGHPPRGVSTRRVDFARMAESMGCAARRIEAPEALAGAIAEAFAADGPCLVDARIDPDGYPAQFKALRG